MMERFVRGVGGDNKVRIDEVNASKSARSRRALRPGSRIMFDYMLPVVDRSLKQLR